MDAEVVTEVDAALWSGVVPLFLLALWLSRPRARDWQPAGVFQAAQSLLQGAVAADATHHPRARVGVACTDDAIRAWASGGEAEVSAALQRRAATLVWFGPPLDWPKVAGWEVLAVGSMPDAAMDAALEPLLAMPARRVVLLITEGAERFFPFFAEAPGLRDQTRAVVLLGADLGACNDWLAEHFRHDTFDLELDRAIPYLTLRTGPGQALRHPPPDPTGRESIEVMDLGEHPPEVLTAGGPAMVLTLAALA